MASPSAHGKKCAEVDLRLVGTKYAAGKISDIEVKWGYQWGNDRMDMNGNEALLDDMDIIYVYSIIIYYNVYYDMLFVWRCRKIITKIRSIIILPIKTVHVGVPRWAYFISGGEDYRLPGSTTFFAFKCWLLSSPLTIMAARDRWGYIYIYDILTYVYEYIQYPHMPFHTPLYLGATWPTSFFSATVSCWNWGLPPSQMRILWRLRPPTEAQGQLYHHERVLSEGTFWRKNTARFEIYWDLLQLENFSRPTDFCSLLAIECWLQVWACGAKGWNSPWL